MSFFQNAIRSITTLYAGHPGRLFIATVKTGFAAHVFLEYGYNVAPTMGPSMLPTFDVVGDWVLISRKERYGRGIKVGDIVSFDSVLEPGNKVIKRILGLEGDYVLRHTPGSGSTEMLQVPQGHCWVIGDNLKHSRDSRHFGPMPMALIKGKVIARVLPWSERTWLAAGIQTPSMP